MCNGQYISKPWQQKSSQGDDLLIQVCVGKRKKKESKHASLSSAEALSPT